jgi:hypothetical protein
LHQLLFVNEQVKQGFPTQVADTKEFFQWLAEEEQGNG